METDDKEEEDLADDRNQAGPDRAERWRKTHPAVVRIVQRPAVLFHSRACGSSFRSQSASALPGGRKRAAPHFRHRRQGVSMRRVVGQDEAANEGVLLNIPGLLKVES